MDVNTEKFKTEALKALNDSTSRSFLDFFLPVLSMVRDLGLSSFPDPVAAVEKARAIRHNAVSRLGDLLETFEKNAIKLGTKVYWARDAEDANAYIMDLIRTNKVPYVTKGKSMISEEIGLNAALEKNGVPVFETDLGEFIIQLLEKPPFHIIGPAINIPPQDICDVFMAKAGMKNPTTNPVELGYAARLFLRDKFKHMRMGITGVNMVVAENGTIINVENEGNIRFNKSAPDIQVSVMSLEKIVPTMEDAFHMLRMLCRNGTGQKLSAYVTMDRGPKKDNDIDGPRELHLVILDNGRSRIYENPRTREVLQCIRCGACINICPVFRHIGGYPYGWAYTGPIGKLLNPLFLGLDRTSDLFGACTLCGACKKVCPAGIDHPEMILYFREMNMAGNRMLKGKGSRLSQKIIATCAAMAASHPGIWHRGTACGRAMIRRLGPVGQALLSWTRHRDLPPLPETSFRDRVKPD
ncbi:MAG: lactate utilization protein [Proteobacteria bacterium]|nr:lactate utilization protein [Pseudomonadota bacterium]